jgi:hypothetical protein
VRGVTAECRTSCVNWLARLRNAEFFKEDFNIPSTAAMHSFVCRCQSFIQYRLYG